MEALGCFREIWCVDFEFHAPNGHRPKPLCVVAREIRSDRVVRVWLADGWPAFPLHAIDSDVLFVAFYASAELGCHLALNWPMPMRILDLFAEFRNITNGCPVPHGNGLLGAMAYFGLDALDATEKDAMRALAMRGAGFTDPERNALLDYCQTDVDSLARLLPRMVSHLDLPRALLRGRYMAAVARMEWNGVPIDTDNLDRLRGNWDRIKSRLVREIDRGYGVFVPKGRNLDPATRFGAAVLNTAREWEINPYALADAAGYVHETEREGSADRLQAIRAARKATGLTVARVNRLIGEGRDYGDVPGFDGKARELAGMYPELGIGIGYDPNGVDEDCRPHSRSGCFCLFCPREDF